MADLVGAINELKRLLQERDKRKRTLAEAVATREKNIETTKNPWDEEWEYKPSSEWVTLFKYIPISFGVARDGAIVMYVKSGRGNPGGYIYPRVPFRVFFQYMTQKARGGSVYWGKGVPALKEYSVAARRVGKKVVVKGNEHWHRVIERKPITMLLLALLLVAAGGLIEMIPTFMVKENIPTIKAVKPYSPLELAGRDLYLREGCYTCHSQMIRPFRSETERYGEYSKAGEFVYDHPFQWGSKRTGPDLAREGGDKLRRMNSWHYNHMMDPGSISSGSIMPGYPWMFENRIDYPALPAKMKAMVTLGVPYTEDEVNNCVSIAQQQAQVIYNDLKKDESKLLLSDDGLQQDHEIIALIAYLQRLGTDIALTPNN